MKRRVKTVSIASLIIIIIIMINLLAGDVFSTNDKKYNECLGTAKEFEGNILIVSVYANDLKYRWNENSDTDKTLNDYYTKLDTLEKTRIATNYLSENISKYGKKVNFIYDWQKNPDLKYSVTFDNEILKMDTSTYDIQNEFIEKNIKVKKIKQKYKANNIFFMFYFNTNNDTEERSYAIGTNLGSYYENEIINITYSNKNGTTMPGTYAHEIMHLFGAPDLYLKNTWISEEYVEYLKNSDSKDLMYTVPTDLDENGNIIITAKFTELDAYYTGLIEFSIDQQEYKLARSEHIPIGNYRILEGDNQTFSLSSNENIDFEFDYDYGIFYNFGNVMIDNQKIINKNLTSDNSNTIITLNEDVIRKLKKGEHTIKLYLINSDGEKIEGTEASTNFTIIN